MKTMYEVFIQSEGGVKEHGIAQFETEKEAVNFCKNHGWVWVDENDFEWNLDWRATV